MSAWKKFTDDSIRWRATIVYRHDDGPVAEEHDLAELVDLHDIVERGPHWDTIIAIKVVRAAWLEGPLTVEESMEL